MHSSEKNGFFTHFFLGSFATLLDTELNKELEVKNIYFRFDGASTLKVMAKTAHKTHVFIFTEDNEINHPLSDQIHNRRFEFTTDELEQINNIRNTEQSGPINEKKIAIQLVHINKSDVTITVDVKKDKPIKRNAGPPPAKFTFKKITTQRGLGDYLENDIKLLAGSDTEQVETVFRKVLAHIKRTQAALNLPQEVYGQGAREANQHGFVAGVLDNFRYRHNTRIYLEQFAGRGYADIVLLIRGSERSIKSIPIIIELKADNPNKTEKTPSNDALNQIKEQYIPGFQPNTVRVLTLSDNILCVGLNLDYVPTNFINNVLNDVNNIIGNDNVEAVLDNNTRADLIKNVKDKLSEFVEINDSHLIKTIDGWQGTKLELKRKIQGFMGLTFKSEVVKREIKNIRPTIVEVLQSTRDSVTDHIELQEQIHHHLERAYSTFPGTKESRSNHYFSRFLLGQSILINEKEYKKHVFHYKKSDIIPTEESPEPISKQPQRDAKIKTTEQRKESSKGILDTSHAITTVAFTPTDIEKPIILLNIVESNRDISIDKKIEIKNNLVGNRDIVKLNIQFRIDNKDKIFKEYCSVQSGEKYNDLEDYNVKNPAVFFQGEFKNILYPTEFKEAFDTALDSQRNEVLSNTEYKKLFEKISAGISPFRSFDINFVALITEEAHFQGVSHGAFSHYSDLKLAEVPETRTLVLTEFQTGRGKRIDMLVHGIGSSLDFKEFKPVGLEFKGPRKNKKADALMTEAKTQLKDYTAVTYKTLTDGDEVQLIPVVFDNATTNVNNIVQLGDELFPVVVIHSSINLIVKRGRESLGTTRSDPKRIKEEASDKETELSVTGPIQALAASSDVDPQSPTSGGGHGGAAPYYDENLSNLFQGEQR
ncbi:MAG: hypothetical protein AB2989_06315 [Candidatus Symbiodolus clandestinus]